MLPKEIRSLWAATAPEAIYPKLRSATAADVVIIGAGIAGLNAGYFLSQKGMKVIVIDSHYIASGTSGNTTAKITSQHFLRYAYLLENFGPEKAKIYADSNEWAISEAERIIQKENIDCDFARLPAYVYSQTNEGLERIKEETAAAQELGLPASFIENIDDVDFRITGATRFDRQAYFHPKKYLNALAEAIKKKGGIIFEETEALDIIEQEEYLVITPTCNIGAPHVIIATNLPFQDKTGIFESLRLSPSYVLAAKLNRHAPEGMFIALDGNKLSFRPHCSEKEEYLLVGESSEAGIENTDRFARLEKVAKENFDIREVDFRWGAQDTMTEDQIPCIGKIPTTKSLFVTTGYNKWGMTLSFVSARILTDLIAGRPNPWTDFYSPERLLKNARRSSATSHLSPAIPTKNGNKELSNDCKNKNLKPDEGKVITRNNKKIAIYKDIDGNFHAHSAICTHLGCTVGWNNKDKTWDCPCHGSRFDKDGQVIHGPAKRDLGKIDDR